MTYPERIKQLLDAAGINYRHIVHEPTYTSAESAAARNESTAIGGKALVLKIGDGFKLFVLSAAKQLDSKALKDYFGVKKLRFANREELMEQTGLVPGSVPPFGKEITGLDFYVDKSILAHEKIGFNIGTLTESIVMQTQDYLDLVKPTIINFSK